MHFLELDKEILNQVVYRGEGNSSIVVALKTQAKVIRLLKKVDCSIRSNNDDSNSQPPAKNIQFIRLVMKPLTEPYINSSAELILLRSVLVGKLDELIKSQRPLHRLKKRIEPSDQYALMMDDLCTLPTLFMKHPQFCELCGPTISVEIKPKQGFLPNYRSVMKASMNDQYPLNELRNCCLYGSYQHLKKERGVIDAISNYCPIDLFSGCPVRMRKALEQLLMNPQNNLRIFKNRSLVFDETKRHEEKFSSIFENFFDDSDKIVGPQIYPLSPKDRIIELVIQCLLRENDESDNDTNASKPRLSENSFSNADLCQHHGMKTRCKHCDSDPSSKKHKLSQTVTYDHKLPESSVLSKVLRVQKLDTIGAHEASRMLDWLSERARDGDELIDSLSKTKMPDGLGSHHQLPNESKEQYYLRKVWEYLVSLTAKDCSIIVTMRRLSKRYLDSNPSIRSQLSKHLLRDPRTGNNFLFNVGIADLDQKLPVKITKICSKLESISSLKSSGKIGLSVETNYGLSGLSKGQACDAKS